MDMPKIADLSDEPQRHWSFSSEIEKHPYIRVPDRIKPQDACVGSIHEVIRDTINQIDREWQEIETAPKKQDVLVFYKNSMGKGRISKACYFSPMLHEDCDPYEGCTPNGEVDEDGYCDEWLCPAGWYEIPAWQNDEGRYWRIKEQITHWMPWPDAPTS